MTICSLEINAISIRTTMMIFVKCFVAQIISLLMRIHVCIYVFTRMYIGKSIMQRQCLWDQILLPCVLLFCNAMLYMAISRDACTLYYSLFSGYGSLRITLYHWWHAVYSISRFIGKQGQGLDFVNCYS